MLYAIIRTDISMTSGKLASQAGHAFVDSLLTAPPDKTKAYLDAGGTKIVLAARNERELCDIYHQARLAKLPCAMVVESGHVMPPSFDGTEIVTAVGIGPIERSAARAITKRLSLMG